MTMAANMPENGPAVPLGEPPDRNPTTLADAADQWVGHVRRALMDGASQDEMRVIGAAFKSVDMMIQQAMAAAGPAGPGAPQGQPGAPPDATSDYGDGGGTPMDERGP